MKKEAILLGSKPASVVALLYLIERGWAVKCVVTSPTQAKWIPRPSLYQAAKKLGVQVVEEQSELSNEPVDLVISYMCRARVKKQTLNLGKHAINFHAGPLPEFGGWAFYNVAILEEAKEYGCTCHIMDEGFDTGPLVKVRRFPISPQNETAISLERKSQIEMMLLFCEIVSIYETEGKLPAIAQDTTLMRYMNAEEFSLLKKVPWDASQEKADRIARAFWYPPYELAYFELPSGARIEAIPEIAKNEVACRYHHNDLNDLLRVAGLDMKLLVDYLN